MGESNFASVLKVGKLCLLGFSMILVSCETAPDKPKNEWPQEFYLSKKACYTRYFTRIWLTKIRNTNCIVTTIQCFL